MDRRETERETKATKNTKNVWKWILGVGAVLMLIAFFGGFFNHDKNFEQKETPSAAVADTVASDSATSLPPDTVYQHVRGTE